MPGNKKPHKKYRPKANLQDPVGYLLEGMHTVRSKGAFVADLHFNCIGAMNALTQGKADRKHMDTLIAASNMAEALQDLGFGADCSEITIGGREALVAISCRSQRVGKFGPSGSDLIALKALMALHEAQLDVITVNDMQSAILHINTKLAKGEATHLPGISKGEIQANPRATQPGPAL
jgi:hypothetical protein